MFLAARLYAIVLMPTHAQLEKIASDLLEEYGDNIPTPEQNPMKFHHLLKMYLYYKGLPDVEKINELVETNETGRTNHSGDSDT